MVSKLCLLAVAALSFVACNGVSTARIVTNAPAEVSVDGQYMGKAPVLVPVPWRNVDNVINFSQRRVAVSVDGNVVWEKDISGDLAQKAQTGDFVDGSQFGTGRTYTINVDVQSATKKK